MTVPSWYQRVTFKVSRDLDDPDAWVAVAEIPGHEPRSRQAHGDTPVAAFSTLLCGIWANPPVQRTNLPTPADLVGILA